jgi:ribosome-associated protein
VQRRHDRDLVVNARVTIPARDLSWTAVRSSGPGGQNVNKVASKVELRFHLEATAALDVATKARLRALAGHRIDADGALVGGGASEPQPAPEPARRARSVVELVRAALRAPRVRRATKPTRASVRTRLADKQHRALTKARRQAPRADEP